MTTASELPRRKASAAGRTHAEPESQPGAPSRTLRLRAAGGLKKFMRGSAFDSDQESGT